MKIFSISLKILFAVLSLLLLTVGVLLAMNDWNTRYLDIENHGEALQNSYVLTNVHVIPMHKDTVMKNQQVYIKNGKIAEVSPKVDTKGVPLIDGENRYLMPGLIDMHVHVWDRYELGLYLANGVTAVRNLWGMPMHLRMKKAISQKKIYGPSFFTSGPKLTGREFMGDDNLNLYSPAEAKEKVANYKERGYDFIKTYYGLDKDLFDAVLEQAEASQMDVVAHPSNKVPFTYHLHSQIKSIEHAEEIVQQPLQFNLDTLQLQPIIEAMAKSKHSAYSPTLIVFYNIYQMMQDESILSSEGLNNINPLIRKTDSENQYNRWFYAKQNDSTVVNRIKKQHDFHLTIVKKLFDAGIPIVCSTDAGIGVTSPGFSIHQELQWYKKAGLPNFEVLKTATVNAAQTHSLMQHLGSIEQGKTANLILLNENPLKSLNTLETPAMVFVEGHHIPQQQLKGFVAKAQARNNLLITALRYAENLITEK